MLPALAKGMPARSAAQPAPYSKKSWTTQSTFSRRRMGSTSRASGAPLPRSMPLATAMPRGTFGNHDGGSTLRRAAMRSCMSRYSV